MQKNKMRYAIVMLTILTTIFFSPAPASAGLASTPTTSWGVSGLMTGTEADGIASEIFAMEQIGDVLYVGGRFTHVTNGAQSIAQPGLAAFDITTGEWISSFRPDIDGAVYGLLASTDGSRLFVGGDFKHVDGVWSSALASLDPATGQKDSSWQGRVGGYQVVRDMKIYDGHLYVAGGFTSVRDNQTHRGADRLARFDITTGTVDSTWFPEVNGGTLKGIDISPDLGRIYLAGNMTSIGSYNVTNGFASVDIATAQHTQGVESLAINAISPNMHFSIDVLVANGLVWVAGSQHSLQVLNEPNLDLNTFYLSRHRGDYQDLKLVGDTVYAGCHCPRYTDIARSHGIVWWGARPDGVSNAPILDANPNSWISAFDAHTGLRDASFVPHITSRGYGVWAIHEAPGGCLWIGGALSATNDIEQFSMTRLCDGDDDERPGNPGRAIATPQANGDVSLTWREATDNVGVAGYRIYDAINQVVLLTSTTTSGTLTNLPAGLTQVYVKAFDASNNESWRSAITDIVVNNDPNPVDITPPTQTGTPWFKDNADGNLTVGWKPSIDNIGVVGYRVYDGSTNQLMDEVTTNRSFLTGLAAGPLSLYVRAFDAAGNESSVSDTTVLIVKNDPAPPPPPPPPPPVTDTEKPRKPGEPTFSNVQGGDITLSWTPSTDNVGVTAYNVYNSQTNTVIAVVTDPEAHLTNLPVGTSRFHVTALDAAGNESWRSPHGVIVIQ